MNFIALLGSGVSLPSGLPSVQEITESILYNEYHMHTDDTFYKGKEPYNGGGSEKAIRIQKFLQSLKKEIDTHDNGKKANYEDLYYICNQMHEHSLGDFINPLIVPFLNDFKSKNSELFEPLNTPDRMEFGYRTLSYYSLIFIQCVVWDSLSLDSEPVGFKLLLDILKSNKYNQNFLVTLNHDLLLENLLNRHDLAYDDGFTQSDGDVFYFDRSLFKSSTHKIQLIKLHGSLDWYRFSSYDENGKQIIKYAKTLNKDRWHCRNNYGELLVTLDGIPKFLTGTSNKIVDYTSDFFKILHDKFKEILWSNTKILISGYGWKDIGINKLLFNWIYNKPENKIILLHRNPENLLDDTNSVLNYPFDELEKSGKLIIIKQWLCDVVQSPDQLELLMEGIYTIDR